jgi:hypothetical protein
LLALQSVQVDPAAQLAVQQLIDKIDHLGASTQIAVGLTAEFKKGLEEATSGVITDQLNLLADIIKGTNEDIHSVGDAFKSMARIAINAIEQIIIKLIALAIAQAVVDALVIGSSAGAEDGGLVTVAAAGGYVIGPRHREGGKRIEVEGGEYIFPRIAVQRYGVKNFRALHAALLGRGGPLPRLIHPGGRYASGGEVTTPDDVTDRRGASDALRVHLDPGLIAEQLETGPGRRAIIKIVNENRRAIGR